MRAVRKMAVQMKRSNADKIKIFKSLFVGLDNAYGTYDRHSGRSFQVKAPVTDEVIKAHLMGRQPYGIYLLVKDNTSAVVADFDSLKQLPPYEFISAARHYELQAYIESSKSKGYHTWIFFKKDGVPAWKARQVVKHILEETEQPSIEIFPKQDRLDSNTSYGNFINAPLFGALVPQGKKVFFDPDTFTPFPNQWDFLVSVERHNESILDDIIEINGLSRPKRNNFPKAPSNVNGGFGLPHCARKMLQEGVCQNQRVSCFRLAVHLKRLGLPFDIAKSALDAWATKNHPIDNRRIITDEEIRNQASYAYEKDYRGYGCEEAAIVPFCDSKCPVQR